MKKVLPWIITIFCLYFAGKSIQMNLQHQRDKARIIQNWKAASQGMHFFKTRSGKQAARVDVLHMKLAEINEIYPEIQAQLADLRIKQRHLLTHRETITETRQEIKTILKTETIYDTVLIKSIAYHDPWTTLTGRIQADTLALNLASRDTVYMTEAKGERRRPWLWILSRRKVQSFVTNTNPHSTVKYYRVIETKPKKTY